MPCYVHFWQNAIGLDQSLAYDDVETAKDQQNRWGGSVRAYPFSSTEYNRRSDPPSAQAREEELFQRKALELAELAGRRPTGEVVAAIAHALAEASRSAQS